MLRLQASPVVIIFLIINFIIISFSAPISETFQDIDLPTDELAENDLSRLSDGELLELERALQQKIEEFENEQNGFVEDSIPIPNSLSERQLKKLIRNRRAGAHAIPIMNDNGAIELFPITDDQQPIVIFEGQDSKPQIEDDRQFVLIPEGEDEREALIPFEMQNELESQLLQEAAAQEQQQQPMILSDSDIDEIELRQRLAELGEQLSERAIRGFY
jgi:hypothetical protein